MPSAYIKQNITGIEGISAVLNGLPDAMQKQIMGTALGEAAKPIVRAARTFAPKKTGALKRSITHVVRRYRNGSVVAVIGPDKSYFKTGKRLKKTDSKKGADKPANYAHLVEFGHATPEGGYVAANPFMRPAVLAAASRTGETLAQGISKGIDKARAKLVKKGRTAA